MSKILQNLSETALVTAIEANLFDFFPLFRHWKHGEMHEDPNMMWSISDIPFPLFNSVVRAQLAPEEVDVAIEAAIARCRARNVPMMWWTGPATQPPDLGETLKAHGFVHGGDSPGMAVDFSNLPDDLPEPPGLVIGKVRDIETIQKWCDVAIRGFGFPDFVIDPFYDFYSGLGFDPELPLRNYIGWLNDEPVAISSLIIGGGVAGIYNIATVPEARRQGIGALMTLVPLQEAQTQGYKAGVLSSSEMGIGVYQSLGFREYCKLGQYLWFPEGEQGAE